MHKTLLLLATCLFVVKMSAQKPVEATNEFTIEGLVAKNLVITLDSLKNHPTTKIDSFVITNHLGERKSVMRNLAVVPIRTFLNQAKINVESLKQLNEIYFVFEAVDGYKVVFSWNELFNNRVGQEVYVIVEKNGKSLNNQEDRISIFSQSDQMTGRRYVKNLRKIVVKRAE